MTTPADEVETLTRWAAGLDRADQDRLLLWLANLLAGQLGPRSRALFDALLPELAEHADPEVRSELLHRIAEASWAPAPLFDILAADADPAAALLLARAPGLSERAAGVLSAGPGSDVAQALAGNRRARLGPETLDRLVELSRGSVALRAPLARRGDLSPEQARRLSAWCGPSLRRALAARFDQAEPPRTGAGPDTARRLVEKLRRSGRLTPDYALAALRRGRLQVFEEALASLGDLELETVRKAGRADTPASLALACAAVGVDRAVFAEVLREVRAANDGLPADDPGGSGAVIAAFARSPAEAARVLRADEARREARWGRG